MIRTVVKYTDNKVFLEDTEIVSTSQKLLPGIYDIEFDEYGRFKNFLEIRTPTVYPLIPSTELENIENYMGKFLSEDYIALCTKSKILIKSGVLLHGDAGIGKSNYINYLINKTITTKEACVFNIDTLHKLSTVIRQVKALREVQNNLFVIVLEEVDELFQEKGTEAILKNFMDGINSVDNLLFLSSTNYLENIPKSLVARPSRFKKVYEIKPSPDITKLKEWLKMTYKGFIDDLTDEDCEKLHDMCLNKTIDEIKHILIDYKMGITKLDVKRKIGFKKGD